MNMSNSVIIHRQLQHLILSYQSVHKMCMNGHADKTAELSHHTFATEDASILICSSFGPDQGEKEIYCWLLVPAQPVNDDE